MSNWSVVSVSFSGLEVVTPAEVLPPEHVWAVTPSCGNDSPGLAVEWWATTHIKHFDPDDLLEALRKVEWYWPEEVCVIWKAEHMDLPRIDAVYGPDEARR